MERDSEKLAQNVLESCVPPRGQLELVPVCRLHELDERPALPPRNVTKVIQHTVIQVQQQFGEVTVKGARNLTIGGTQNIGSAEPPKEKEEKSPTGTEKIMERTVSKLTEWTCGMVKTSALAKVMDRLNNGTAWLCIKGSPGEGKSTVAFMALEELHRAGREVFQVISPEEFAEVTRNCLRPVIVLDDIFGELEFDQTEWLRWKPVLHPILDVKEHLSNKQAAFKRKDKAFTVILVARDYVLNSVSSRMGRLSDFVTKEQHVVNMSHSVDRELEEKLDIWKAIMEPSGVQLSHKKVVQICQVESHHGFPHVCRLFVTVHKEAPTVSVEKFFHSPLEFLDLTIKSFFSDELKLNLFKEMVKKGGRVSVRDLQTSDSGFESVQTAHSLVGAYLKMDGDSFLFDHPSIYDSVVYNFCKLSLLFVIEYCEMSFIHERLRLDQSRDTQHDASYSESGLVVHIPSSYELDLAKRFAAEITNGIYLQVLSHQACTDIRFINTMMSLVQKQLSEIIQGDMDESEVYTFEEPFLWSISSNKSPYLLKYVAEKTHILQKQDEVNMALYGICKHAASDVLTYLMENTDLLDINVRFDFTGETLLMVAATTRDSQFVHQVMSLCPDLDAKSSVGKSVCDYLCENGLVQALEEVIASGADVDLKNSCVRWACLGNQVQMIDFLLDRGASPSLAMYYCLRYHGTEHVNALLKAGADVNIRLEDGSTALHDAAMKGSKEHVQVLLKAGADVNVQTNYGITPLGNAVSRGADECLRLLTESGANVHVQFEGGLTPLHVASIGRYRKCLSILLKAGVDVNLQSNDGYTPLHAAAGYVFRDMCMSLPETIDSTLCEKYECVNMLLDAGANVNQKSKADITPLHIAAEEGSLECVEPLLEAGADVNAESTDGITPLHKAVNAGSLRCTDILIRAGANVNIQSRDCYAPLHTAIGGDKSGYLLNANISFECIDRLLKAGANVNVQSEDGTTPLHEAVVQRCSTECIKMLLESGADVNVQNKDGSTALLIAAGEESKDSIELLLKFGADVNVQNKDGSTALLIAAGEESKDSFELLLKFGAGVNVQNKDGSTALHKAAEVESKDSFELLLKFGADVNVQNKDGSTALLIAAGEESKDSIELLLKFGADVNVQNKDGSTALLIAAGEESKDSIELLLKFGADVNVQNKDGSTALLIAAGEESKDSFELLLKFGADVNVQNKDGSTALLIAAGEESKDSFELLLKFGAGVNVQNKDGSTALHKAAEVESKDSFELLLKFGADVNVQNKDGSTALLKAAEVESEDSIELLLKAGADVNVGDNHGITPLHISIEKEHKEVIDLLLAAGADKNTVDKQGQTLLHKAVYRRRLNNIGYYSDYTDYVLDIPCLQECQELIGYGACVNKQDPGGNTPLHLLCQVNSDDPMDLYFPPSPASTYEELYRTLVTLLVDHGADVNMQNIRGEPALHGWCQTLFQPDTVEARTESTGCCRVC